MRSVWTAVGACTCALAVAVPALGVGMGKTQVAKGQSGERQAITPLKVTDNVPGYTVGAGKRIACLKLRVKNVGTKAFSEFPGTGADLRLRGGVTEDASITGGGACKSTGLIKLKPGKSVEVQLPYELRKSDRIVGFQYTASSGFGTNTPVWTF